MVLKAVQCDQVKLIDIVSLIKCIYLIRYHLTVDSTFGKVEARAGGFKERLWGEKLRIEKF